MGGYLGLVELGLTLGFVLAFGWWELRGLRKLRKARQRDEG